HPASPIPKRKRIAISDPSPQVHPVAAVKKDHQSTTRTSVLRGPYRSPNHPVGISNSAYAIVKALKIQPTASSCSAPTRPNVARMSGMDHEMQTRSMY